MHLGRNQTNETKSLLLNQTDIASSGGKSGRTHSKTKLS
jgi:hypothetical protein